jgi:hypothetical protein
MVGGIKSRGASPTSATTGSDALGLNPSDRAKARQVPLAARSLQPLYLGTNVKAMTFPA